MKTKKIVFLTGTRADFGKLKALISKVEKSNLFDCYIFVTGMHTLSKYGPTFHEVQKNNYRNIFVFMNQTHTTDLDIILSNTIIGFSNFIKEIEPDMVIIHGDRVEALAGAIVGSLNNIRVAHVEGGELSGNIDESIRHSITKLVHIHFVANDEAKKRLLQMGEVESSIFVIGSPDIDVMLSKLPSIKEAKSHYNIRFPKYSIVIYHPETFKRVIIEKHVRTFVSALKKSNRNYVFIYPNNDSGSDIIINQYQKLKNYKRFAIFPSIRFEYFLSILKSADFIIGNSSSGVREAEIYGIPTINIGSRQNKRTKNQEIIHAPTTEHSILKAIKQVKNKKIKKKYSFGDGKSSEKFYKLLRTEITWKIPLQKKFMGI